MQNLAVCESVQVRPQGQFFEVLILDDSDFDRKRLRRALSQLPLSLNITEASNLHSFHQQVRHKEFNLILIDYALADGDGLQAIGTCQEWNLNENALFVMVTGNDTSSLAVNALKSGFDDYVSKDAIDHDMMSQLISSSTQKKHHLRTPCLFHIQVFPRARMMNRTTCRALGQHA